MRRLSHASPRYIEISGNGGVIMAASGNGGENDTEAAKAKSSWRGAGVMA